MKQFPSNAPHKREGNCFNIAMALSGRIVGISYGNGWRVYVTIRFR